jgi:2-keto-4-pentenoate hydratase
MNSPDPVDQIVQGLVAARRSGQAWAWPVGEQPPDLSLDEAYAVQAGVARAMGWFAGRPTAWKVGGSPVITAAPLPQVWPSPATWAALALAGANSPDEVLVEAELAFRLAATPAHANDILACLGTVCVSLEVIGTRLAQGLSAPAHCKLADQGVHGGLVVGTELPYAACAGFTEDDWRQQACALRVNGAVRQQLRGSHPTVNPLLALPWLVRHAAQHTGGLRAGDIVTTGAWAVVPVQWGDLVEVAFEGLGSVTLRATARHA